MWGVRFVTMSATFPRIRYKPDGTIGIEDEPVAGGVSPKPAQPRKPAAGTGAPAVPDVGNRAAISNYASMMGVKNPNEPPVPRTVGPTQQSVQREADNLRFARNYELTPALRSPGAPSLEQAMAFRDSRAKEEQLRSMLRPVQQPVTREQALRDIAASQARGAEAGRSGAAEIQMRADKGQALSPYDIAERERLTQVLFRNNNPDPAAVAADADRRVRESEQRYARQEAGRTSTGEQVTAPGGLPIEGARAEAQRSEGNRRMIEAYYARQAREAAGRQVAQAGEEDATALAQTKAAGQIAQATGATASQAANPALMQQRFQMEQALNEGKISEAQASTALSKAKADAIRRGISPEVVGLENEQNDAALAKAAVLKGAAMETFRTLLPRVQPWVSQGNISDYLTGGGGVGNVSSATGFGSDSAISTISQLEDAIAPLEQAAKINPNAARAEARAILAILPATNGTSYTASGTLLPGGSFNAGHIAIAARLNELRSRVAKLAAGQ